MASPGAYLRSRGRAITVYNYNIRAIDFEPPEPPMHPSPPQTPVKGRGATFDPPVRFDSSRREPCDDGWQGGDADPPLPRRTKLLTDTSRSIITRNRSPDVPFDRSINPYRGCEHGCVYCFARPTHAYLGYSPGLDFETRILHKPNGPELLQRELAKPGYRCAPIALGVNTDAYQPLEKRLGLTRRLLEVLVRCRHPVSLITKSGLIRRDLDLLSDLARDNLVSVGVSVTTLDRHLARTLEPRAAAPYRRLETIAALSTAGIPVHLSVAPVIPVLTDSELEAIMAEARAAGAGSASYILLRLPHEVKTLFRAWLDAHRPNAAEHVMARIRETRGGRDNDPAFGSRMRGGGVFADLLRRRFEVQHRRLGFGPPAVLDRSRFAVPNSDSDSAPGEYAARGAQLPLL